MDIGESSSSLRNEGNSAYISDDNPDGASVKPPNVEQRRQLSNSGSSDDDLGPLEDVTICDICGDAGREDLLVVCSKCSDGAEHTYCMRTRLDEVPDEWICEDCLRLKDNNKRSQTEVEKSDTEGTVLKEPQQDSDMSGQSVVKAHPVTDAKRLGAEKHKGDKETSSLSDEASSGILSIRRTFRAENASVMCSKALKSQDSAMKQNSDLSVLNGDPSRQMRRNGSVLTFPGQDLSKSNRLLMQAGALTKSMSFSVFDRRPRTRLLDKNPLSRKRKASATRSLRKSVSFGDSISSNRGVPDPRTSVVPPKVSELGGLNRSRSMKAGDLLELETKPELRKPSQIPLEGRPLVAVSSDDRKFATSGDSRSIHGTKICDQKGLGNTKESVEEVLGTNNACDVKVSSNSISLKSKEHLTNPCVVRDKVPVLEKQQSLKTPDFNCGGVSISEERKRASRSQSQNITDDWNDSSGPVLDVGRVKHTENRSLTDPSLSFEFLNADQICAVPMFDYIWKGEFEVQSSGSRLPRLSYKIQAYLSTLSSPRIPEVVKNFSDKIILEEVSRLSTWPQKFVEHQPKDDCIGLYFFAEDVYSYPNYKSLLRCMIDYDLALKGNFSGIELLIFSSNLLPEKSQRWNNMLFLWGTFRERKFAKV